MATTDAKPGFRLPWSADRSADAPTQPNDATPPAGDAAAAADPSASHTPTDAPGATPSEETESPAMIDAAPAATTTEGAVDADGAAPASEPGPGPAALPSAAAMPSRKPNKFMADLTKAMQAAAESARADALERLTADAKAHVEAIHADSATESTELRKQADDDVAAVREWSKAEIARIREETDERITHRKERLEREIEQHAAEIEARIERVQGRVAAFEAEMAAFFERLLAEEDPTRFAAMAESLPEPPPFDRDAPIAAAEPETPVVAAAPEPVAAEFPPEPSWEPVAPPVTPTAEAEADAVSEPVAQTDGEAEAAPVDAAWPDAETEMTVPTGAGDADLFSIGADEPSAGDDPRLSVLGLTPDFAAAEAEAASFSPEPVDDGSDEVVPDLADEAIAARLAGIVPEAEAGTEAEASPSTTLIVTGLVSVASIAGFKRHLSRVGGVKHVGVSSGPDGEFVYLVSHDPGVALRDAVPGLPGFAARVTDDADGTLTVVAQDPESGS
jgi:hypothetical protein